MELMIDPDVQAVLEFMQSNLQASRLVAVACALPQMATLLWGHYPQEHCCALTLTMPKPHPSPVCAIPTGKAIIT